MKRSSSLRLRALLFFVSLYGFSQAITIQDGTSTLRLPSLGGAELPGATVFTREVRYEDTAPTVAQIRGGTVERSASRSEVLATFADDTLRVKRVYFEDKASPATNHVLADAMLFLPAL